MIKRPNVELAQRPLHIIWIVDCSTSMSGERINSLNFAIKEALPAMRDTANDNPNAQMLCRAVSFASSAKWHIATPTPIEQFEWIDVQAGGTRSMGAALKLVAQELTNEKMGNRALPPVLILLSDGKPTDDFQQGLNELMALSWGKKATRISIAIGQDADLDTLQKFIRHNELQPL